MQQPDIKKILANANAKKSIRIVLLLLVTAVVIDIILRLTNFNVSDYFITKNVSSSVITDFNPKALIEHYKNFTSVPYFISSEFDREKEKDAYRVFLLGEASATGWPYTSEQSIANKIRNSLNQYTVDKKIEIISVCFAGFNSSYARELVPQIIEYNPDLIILYNGHNEFYGYNGITETVGNSSFTLFSLLKRILFESGVKNTLEYNSDLDDLELLMPLYSDKQIIQHNVNNYNSIIDQFADNILAIAEVCEENNVGLVLSTLADNYLLPPLGVANVNEHPNADLIFNNARMALLRDGNKAKAVELFLKSKDLDAFRIRVPQDFDETIRQISRARNIMLADLKSKFSLNSQDNIPGNDLFVDYFHPNLKGLDLIASTFTELILLDLYKNYKGGEHIEYNKSITSNIGNYTLRDSLMADIRIAKVFSLLESNKFDSLYTSPKTNDSPEETVKKRLSAKLMSHN